MLWLRPATFCRPLASTLRPGVTGSGASAAVTLTLGAKLIFGVLPPWLKSMPSFSALCADCPPAVCHCETMVTPNHATVLPPTV